MGINKLKVVLTEEAQAFLDTEEETLVIATHGIVKKTQKTPLKEIAKAEGSVNSVKSVGGSHSLIRAIRVRSSQGYVFGLRGYGRDAIPSYISFRLIR